MQGRRDVLKLGFTIAAAGVVAPLLAACATPSRTESVTAEPKTSGSPADAGSSTLSGSITVVLGGDLGAQPALQKVYDDFKALNTGITWDVRGLQGGGPEWNRLARAAMASGEPIGLVGIDGQSVRAWARDGLLADLGADPQMAQVLARVPKQFHLSGPGETTTRAFPLAVSGGVYTTGMYYNKSILDRAGLEPPKTIADLKAMVKPLAALGVSPLVFNSGDVFYNPLLVTWVLPMISGADPLAFAERTVRGEVKYDSPEWIEAFQTIADLRTSGAFIAGAGATDYATMQQLVLRGKAALTYSGTWLLPELLAGSPTGPFDLHVAPLPRFEATSTPHSILAWGGFALPAKAALSRDSVYAFLEYASRPEVDGGVVEARQAYSPIPESNVAIHNAVAREFLPMFDDAITPFDWLCEPEITAEIGDQVQALVKGATDPASVGKALEAVAEQLRSSGRSFYK